MLKVCTKERFFPFISQKCPVFKLWEALTLLEGTDFLGIVSIAFFLTSVYFLTSVDLFSL